MKRRQNSVKKESKKAAKSQLSSPLTTGLCDLKEKYQNEYIHSKPYTHAVIDELCNRDRMKAIHAEITSKITVDYKETDLFKVLQSKELGNISINDDLPELLSLRTALYSDEFRGFISAVTGCNDLIDRVDCSLNAYSTGCHLLCHDDVIGTRRVSYIIYLTDPDDDWLVSDGGA
jgi:Rps23 Pro-64 3,4-dihydroxylase Tpa1-like proline 4-hydroxylase